LGISHAELQTRDVSKTVHMHKPNISLGTWLYLCPGSLESFAGTGRFYKQIYLLLL